MNKKLFWATFVYVLSIFFCLVLMYVFMRNNGFDEENFLFISGGILIMALSMGHVLASHLLAPKVLLDASLSHLSSEILHELNIPLSTIKANTMLLKKHLEDEKSLQRLGRIEASSIRLERLYKELVYSIRKELQPIEKERFSLKQLLEERIEVFEAFERNHFLADFEECSITVDKIGFEKMIDNILMNAMKYSSRESPIKLKLKDKILCIQDEGIGMDETQILKVYERYYQGDKEHEGEGIGLALVKAYCDEEDIEIQIKSQKDKGTIVSLNVSKVSDKQAKTKR